MSVLRLLLPVLLVLAVTATSSADGPDVELAVIVNPEVDVAKLGVADIAEIFTLSRRNWSNGRDVLPFNLAANDALRVIFDHAVLNMSPDEVGRFWIDQRIRGGLRPPRQVDDPKLVLRLVARLPGAIGYLPRAQVDASVRVVARIVNGRVESP